MRNDFGCDEALTLSFESPKGGACSRVWERPLLWNSTGSTKASSKAPPCFVVVTDRGQYEGSTKQAMGPKLSCFGPMLIFSSPHICVAVLVGLSPSCKTAPTTFYKRVSCKGQKVWREEGVSIQTANISPYSCF